MYLRQIADPALSQYSYIIGCQRSGEAVVVDPERDIGRYLEDAAGLKITAVAETHIHADFVSGAREFAHRDPSVKLYLSAAGGEFWRSVWAEGLPGYHPLRDGDTFKIGNIGFRAIHTPGHTPEHMVFLVTDHGGGADEPIALLMGFVGWRMWLGKGENSDAPGPCVLLGNGRLGPGCHVRLSAAGAVAGVLSGLFGIGGGFVVVPALLYVTGTSIHRAVATSLMVIFLVSVSGVAAKIVQGLDFPMPLAVLFPLGGVAGMLAGGALRSRLGGPALRRVFAAAIWAVAAWMLWQRAA